MSNNNPSLDAIAAAAGAPQEAPDMAGGNEPAAEAFDVGELGTDCPIEALGFLKQKFHFLDAAGQHIELGSEFRKGELMALFGTRMGWLDGKWPQFKKVSEKGGENGGPLFEKDGFSQKLAQQGLILACSKRGLFDPRGRIRGRGAHLGDNRELVFHCGNVVLVGGQKGIKGRVKQGIASFRPGLVAGYVYPTMTALPTPHEFASSTTIAETILELLSSWNWKRGEIAPYLLMCWIATALLGGALRIRPHGWIVGPSGAGKTTLQQFLRDLMGDWAIDCEDATEAGVRQLIDQDTLAVMFDEIEAEADNQEVVLKIVRLARLAYSGASAVRGSSDHQAKTFVARSCFLFSSIHYHELPAQDRNRIAILQLSKFAPNTAQFVPPPLAKEWGHQLRRRLLEQWPRYEATLQAYQREMLEQGYSGREQDTYGTLLACGDLLMHDNAPIDTQSGRTHRWVKALGLLVDAARTEAEDTSERCVKHLASHRLPAKGGEQQTVSRWLQKLVMQLHLGMDGDGERLKLGMHGLRLVHLKDGHQEGNGQGGMIDAFQVDGNAAMWVAIANKTNKGVQEIFADSMWKGGVWTQSLALVEGAWTNKKSRFGGGTPEGCVLVPLDQLIDREEAIKEAERSRP